MFSHTLINHCHINKEFFSDKKQVSPNSTAYDVKATLGHTRMQKEKVTRSKVNDHNTKLKQATNIYMTTGYAKLASGSEL